MKILQCATMMTHVVLFVRRDDLYMAGIFSYTYRHFRFMYFHFQNEVSRTIEDAKNEKCKIVHAIYVIGI